MTIDLKGKADFADYMIVASGRSQRHVASIADKLVDTLRKAGVSTVYVEGQQNSDWILVDCIDVVVHVFRPELRTFYNLEKMWAVPLPKEEAAFA